MTSDVVLQISCGYLTVLEDRAKPDGRTIQVFVIRVEPSGGTSTRDPMIGIGNIAKQDDYGETVGVGQRTHRVAYLIDPRGMSHTKPALDCPEVAAVGPALAGLRLRDPARRTMELDAVRACHDRLVGQGIDLAAYDLRATAEDIEDLRTTLGIGSWNVMAYGDGSRIAFEVERRFPAGLRSVFVDSLSLPTPDLLTVGPASLDLAIARLVAACAAQPACAIASPHLDTMIQEATARLDAKPVTFNVTDTVATRVAGHPIRVVVDGAAAVRWIRASLAADGGKGASNVPQMLRAALDGHIAVTDPIVVDLAADTGNCLGLLPNCAGIDDGVLNSILCRDVAPRIDGSRLTASVDGRRAYADVFAPSPLLVPCDVWSVGASDPYPSNAGSLTNGVPTVVMRGAFDPFSAPANELRVAASDPAVYSHRDPERVEQLDRVRRMSTVDQGRLGGWSHARPAATIAHTMGIKRTGARCKDDQAMVSRAGQLAVATSCLVPRGARTATRPGQDPTASGRPRWSTLGVAQQGGAGPVRCGAGVGASSRTISS